jgi:glycosyltransferase involved in cell wall biosynthesis
MDRVTILVCTPRFHPQVGGAETWTREVVRGLGVLGHRVSVVAGSARGLPAGNGFHEVRVRRAPGGRLGLALAIGSSVRRIHPDVVIAQYSALPPAVAIARMTGTPVLGVVHDVYGLAESVRIKGPVGGLARYLGLERPLRLLAPDGFLVPSHATASRLRAVAAGPPITVVPVGADHLPRGDPVRRDPRQIAFVGRLVRQKGLADLISALRMLRERDVPCRAVIVGRGPEEERLRRLVQKSSISVTFLGSVDDRSLERVLRSSTALVLPSTREGWGLAVTEAAATGTPYIAYDIPAIQEQHALLCGGLVVPSTPSALSEAIRSLVQDPARAGALGGQGQLAAAELSWVDSARVVETAVARAIQRRPTRSTIR